MKTLISLCIGTLALVSLAAAQPFGTVSITEVMYDDTANVDVEWVELHNNADTPITIGGWVLLDDYAYPPPAGGEGALLIPAGTSIPVDGYLVISLYPLDNIDDEIVCSQFGGVWTLGNTGDNLALYNAASGGTLIDGSLTDAYPDEAGQNLGRSVEKCSRNSTWTADTASWHESTQEYSTTGRYRRCTPGEPNTTCQDTIPPQIGVCDAFGLADMLDIYFTESMDPFTPSLVNSYLVMPGNIVPLSAERDLYVRQRVRLIFPFELENGEYKLYVDGPEDLSGNPIRDGVCEFVMMYNIHPGDVVISEIMYDDTATLDQEWVELYNTTQNPIDLSFFILGDGDDMWPFGSEGVLEIPYNTVISAHGFLILSDDSLPQITNEVICMDYSDDFDLGNGPAGDNLALYPMLLDEELIDGSFTANYPDLAGDNAGYSIERCDLNAEWSGSPSAWTVSQAQYSTTGRYRRCTPFAQGNCCTDPATGSVAVTLVGPPVWQYSLTQLSGCLDHLVFTNFCVGTTGSLTGTAANAWTIPVNGDGNNGDSIIFVAAQPQGPGTVDGFQLNHPFCSDLVTWIAGGSSGQVDGPLPVELNDFSAEAGDGLVTLNWSTGSESELDAFEVRRNGELLTSVAARNAETGSRYSFTDVAVRNDVTYDYELTVVTLAGERTVLAAESATPHRGQTVITEFALYQNYPNPFNPTTTIAFDLVESGLVTLTVYNISGQAVATPVDGILSAGAHSITFDASTLSSGVYLYRLTAGSFTRTMKMFLMQ